MRRCDNTESGGVTPRQRLILFADTELSADKALALPDEQLTAGLLIEQGVKASSIMAAGIGPRQLHKMGVSDADTLRRMGFDPLYLVDARFCSEANATFGAASVKATFLCSASDAVCLAGSAAVAILGISTGELLRACAGASVEAFAVMQQVDKGQALFNVDPDTLLDTGLRKQKLLELGYSLSNVVAQTGAGSKHLRKLGFV